MKLAGLCSDKVSGSSDHILIFSTFRYLFLAILCIAISACSNSSDGTHIDTPVTDDPPVEEPSSVVAVVDGNGGSVTLGNLSLDIAPGALADSQQISIEKQPPEADELARFSLKPAGLRFIVASELRFELPGLPSTANFFWAGPGGELSPFPSQADGNIVSAQIRFIGYAEQDALLAQSTQQTLQSDVLRTQMFTAASTSPDSDAAAQLIVKSINCEGDLAILASRLSNLNNFDSMDEAQAIFDRASSLLQTCAEIEVALLQQQSCDRLGEAVANSSVTIPGDTDEFLRVISTLLGASAMVQTTEAACSNVDPEQADTQVREKFVQMAAVLQGRLVRGNLTGEDGADAIKSIVEVAARCDTLELGEVCDSISSTTIPDLLDSMRNAAFADCRTAGNGALAVSQLYALGSVADGSDKFFGFARFSLSDLERDLVYCTGPSISLTVFDDAEPLPDELTDRAATLQALGGLGSYNRTIRVEVPRDGSLTVSGAAAALRCPDESVSNVDIVYRINNVEVARRSRNGLIYPLSAPPVDLVLARVLPIAGLDPETTSDFALKINREGGLCTDSIGDALSDPFELFEVNVVVNPVVSVESEWIGTATLEYEFSASWDQTITRTASLGCFFSFPADCELGQTGQVSGSLRLDIEQASSGVVPIGTTTDINVNNISVLGALASTQGASADIEVPDLCVVSGSSSLNGSANAVSASSAGVWQLRVSNTGFLELSNSDISTAFSGSQSGSSTQTFTGTDCGVGIPIGTINQTIGPNALNINIPLILRTFSGFVDPDSNEWRGTDTKIFNGRDGQCSQVLTLPNLGGSPAPSAGVTCSVTSRVSWSYTRQ